MNASFDFPWLLDGLAGPVGVKLAFALLHFVWQGVLIAAVAAVLMRWVGRRSSQRRYAIGVASLALMAVAPVVTFVLVTPPAPPVDEPAPLADVSNLLVDLEQIDVFLTTLDVSSGEAPVIAPQPVRLTWSERLRLIQPYAVLLWLAGTLLCGLRLVAGAWSSVVCRRGRRPVPETWLQSVAQAARQIGLNAPRVFVSDRVAEAIAVGLLRPMVLLPAAWISRIPPDVLEAVLAHELAHIRRHDLWVNLFQRVVESLLFYHPAVWWLSRRIRIEREYCCDETAAAAVTGRAAYARALEYVATERVAGGRTELFQAALAAGMRGEDSMTLLNRVHRVLGNEARPRRTPRLSEGLLALAVPAALWAAVVTIGPAFAQEAPVEAPQAEPTLDDVVEEVHRDFDVQPGKSIDDVIDGLAQNDGFEGQINWTPPDADLHDALRELREELKSLRSEVEELRAGKKESQTDPTEIDRFVIERLHELNAAAAARDEALERSLDFEYAKDRDPESERRLREQLREAQQRLEEIAESLKQAGFEPPNLPPGVAAGAGDHHYNFTLERGPDGKSRIKAVRPGKSLPATDAGSPVTQILFTGPAGSTISGRDPRTGHDWEQTAPARHFFPHNASYEFKFSNIPGRKGLVVKALLQLPPVESTAKPYLSKNSIPFELTNEDLDQVESKNIVTKVIYLPNAGADSGIETLVSTRLDAGVDPVAEARRRGAVLAVMSFARDSLHVPFQKLTDDGFTPVGNLNSLPAEITGSDGRRYRAVTEEIRTKDGTSIPKKRLVPVDAKPDGPADGTLMMKYKAAGLLRDAAVRELVEAKKQKQIPDVIEHLQNNVDEAQRWLEQLGEELEERKATPDGPFGDIDPQANNPPVIGALTGGQPEPPHSTGIRPHDGGKETTSDEDFHSFIDGPGPGVLRREQARTLDATDGLPTRANGGSANVTGGKPAVASGGVTTVIRGDRIVTYRMGSEFDLLEVEIQQSGLPKSDEDRKAIIEILTSLFGENRPVWAKSSQWKKLDEGRVELEITLWNGSTPTFLLNEHDGRLRLKPIERFFLSDGSAPFFRHSPRGGVVGSPFGANDSTTNDTSDRPSTALDDVTKALEKPVSLHFDKTPLNHVVATLRNIAGVNFVIDEAGLDEEGLTPETPVSINVDDMPIHEVLSTVLLPLNLTATTDDGIVKITSVPRSKGPLHVETYPVGDLVLPVLKLLELGELPSRETAFSKDVKEQMAINVNALHDLISGTIEPGSWEQVGGQGVIRWNTATLSFVVRQTNDVHDEIAALLQRMRRMKSEEVQVPGQSGPHSGILEDMRDATLAWQMEDLRKQLAALEQSPDSLPRRQSLQKQIEQIESLQDEIATERRENDHHIRDTRDKINRRHFTPSETQPPESSFRGVGQLFRLATQNLLLHEEPRSVEGKVVQIVSTANGNDQILITPGSNAGLRKGATVEVFRDNEFVAKLEMTSVEEMLSLGRIVQRAKNAVIREGDRVIINNGP